jgi:dihydrofolate reductase
MTFKVSGPSAKHLRGLWSELGAVLTGRRTFEVADGWGGNHAWGPAFVLTHHIPAGWPRSDSTVHFVTDGIESAVNQAKTAAAGKSVGVHGADTIQQFLNAGLLDESSVDIAAVLLGSGARLFEHLAGTPAVLGNPKVIAGVGVTHLRYPRYAKRSPTRRNARTQPDLPVAAIMSVAGSPSCFQPARSVVMAYDRADWHYGGDYPAELPPENGGTHIGMFLAWAIINDLHGDLHREESQASVERVKKRAMTGREFLFKECDEKFWDNDLNDEGNAFASWYYESEGDHISNYLEDYEAALGRDLPTLYHVEDTWENYDRIASIISQRFMERRVKQ